MTTYYNQDMQIWNEAGRESFSRGSYSIYSKKINSNGFIFLSN